MLSTYDELKKISLYLHKACKFDVELATSQLNDALESHVPTQAMDFIIVPIVLPGALTRLAPSNKYVLDLFFFKLINSAKYPLKNYISEIDLKEDSTVVRLKLTFQWWP